MTLKERAFFCLFVSGLFSKPKLERVCGLPFDELIQKVPELAEFQDFNMMSNRQRSLDLIKRMRDEVPVYRGVFDKFLHSSFYFPLEFLIESFTRVGPRLNSVQEFRFDDIFGGD